MNMEPYKYAASQQGAVLPVSLFFIVTAVPVFLLFLSLQSNKMKSVIIFGISQQNAVFKSWMIFPFYIWRSLRLRDPKL
jgi:hypothetical protein